MPLSPGWFFWNKRLAPLPVEARAGCLAVGLFSLDADSTISAPLPMLPLCRLMKGNRGLRFMSRIVYVGDMNRIQVSPEIHFGKPCVAGTRIPVQAVLELVREAIPFESIIRDYYPDLKMEDIQACIQYAIDVVQTEDIHVAAPS
jgi:uncharacterized protein (DUF433 family)